MVSFVIQNEMHYDNADLRWLRRGLWETYDPETDAIRDKQSWLLMDIFMRSSEHPRADFEVVGQIAQQAIEVDPNRTSA